MTSNKSGNRRRQSSTDNYPNQTNNSGSYNRTSNMTNKRRSNFSGNGTSEHQGAPVFHGGSSGGQRTPRSSTYSSSRAYQSAPPPRMKARQTGAGAMQLQNADGTPVRKRLMRHVRDGPGKSLNYGGGGGNNAVKDAASCYEAKEGDSLEMVNGEGILSHLDEHLGYIYSSAHGSVYFHQRDLDARLQKRQRGEPPVEGKQLSDIFNLGDRVHFRAERQAIRNGCHWKATWVSLLEAWREDSASRMEMSVPTDPWTDEGHDSEFGYESNSFENGPQENGISTQSTARKLNAGGKSDEGHFISPAQSLTGTFWTSEGGDPGGHPTEVTSGEGVITNSFKEGYGFVWSEKLGRVYFTQDSYCKKFPRQMSLFGPPPGNAPVLKQSVTFDAVPQKDHSPSCCWRAVAIRPAPTGSVAAPSIREATARVTNLQKTVGSLETLEHRLKVFFTLSDYHVRAASLLDVLQDNTMVELAFVPQEEKNEFLYRAVHVARKTEPCREDILKLQLRAAAGQAEKHRSKSGTSSASGSASRRKSVSGSKKTNVTQHEAVAITVSAPPDRSRTVSLCIASDEKSYSQAVKSGTQLPIGEKISRENLAAKKDAQGKPVSSESPSFSGTKEVHKLFKPWVPAMVPSLAARRSEGCIHSQGVLERKSSSASSILRKMSSPLDIMPDISSGFTIDSGPLGSILPEGLTVDGIEGLNLEPGSADPRGRREPVKLADLTDSAGASFVDSLTAASSVKSDDEDVDLILTASFNQSTNRPKANSVPPAGNLEDYVADFRELALSAPNHQDREIMDQNQNIIQSKSLPPAPLIPVEEPLKVETAQEVVTNPAPVSGVNPGTVHPAGYPAAKYSGYSLVSAPLHVSTASPPPPENGPGTVTPPMTPQTTYVSYPPPGILNAPVQLSPQAPAFTPGLAPVPSAFHQNYFGAPQGFAVATSAAGHHPFVAPVGYHQHHPHHQSLMTGPPVPVATTGMGQPLLLGYATHATPSPLASPGPSPMHRQLIYGLVHPQIGPVKLNPSPAGYHGPPHFARVIAAQGSPPVRVPTFPGGSSGAKTARRPTMKGTSAPTSTSTAAQVKNNGINGASRSSSANSNYADTNFSPSPETGVVTPPGVMPMAPSKTKETQTDPMFFACGKCQAKCRITA